MTTSKEDEIKSLFEMQEEKYSLPSGLLTQIYEAESAYLRQTSRLLSKKEIMKLILESVPKDSGTLDSFLKKHLEDEEEKE
jgi:hypothetical protein